MRSGRRVSYGMVGDEHYRHRTDDELHALAHQRAFARNSSSTSRRTGEHYCAAFKSYTAPRALSYQDGAVCLGSEASGRGEAVIWLLESDDLARQLGLQLR